MAKVVDDTRWFGGMSGSAAGYQRKPKGREGLKSLKPEDRETPGSQAKKKVGLTGGGR